MNPLLVGPLLDIGKSVIERIFPDKEKQAQDRAQAELALAQMQQDGTMKLLSAQLSAIIAEAQSPDPWTSRSRPSFLYVMYILILWSIPMGILSAFKPEIATAITKGMTGYLAAIPEPLYVLFGTGYLGYTAARQFGKTKGTDK
jgi:hypothetical protein